MINGVVASPVPIAVMKKLLVTRQFLKDVANGKVFSNGIGWIVAVMVLVI